MESRRRLHPRVRVTRNSARPKTRKDIDLHDACTKGDMERVTRILSESPVRINKKGRYRWIPVMWAAHQGQREVFDLLVSKGGDVSQVDDVGDNILHVACYGGHVEMVEHLLSKDIVDVNTRGRYGWTPVMRAAFQGHTEVFDLLVSKGGDISRVDAAGENILHVASSGGHVEMVKHVLSKDVVDINGRGRRGRTAVMIAGYMGHEKVFDLLVNKGADLCLVGDNGDTILHWASVSGNMEIVKQVLSQDIIDINARDKEGRTACMVAGCSSPVYSLFVSRGCHVK
ncbi:serine/threonine-protein phosphatase 6 regulatory ankyrin repeat subunit C-like [Haliotis cracherodii]|uniref:serine/threonine-protein phosphatase 6 regulatory ankyrin repeat subunit C-like n=1 Tax=Haliotis cracherodii TaxID=6455 RepID=UPI0039E7887F